MTSAVTFVFSMKLTKSVVSLRYDFCCCAPCLVAVSQCPETEGILDMARRNVPATCVAFKRLLWCSDDRSLPLVKKICNSMGFRATPTFE